MFTILRAYFFLVLHYLYILWSILCFLSIKLAVGNLNSKVKNIHVSMIPSEDGMPWIFAITVLLGYGHFFSTKIFLLKAVMGQHMASGIPKYRLHEVELHFSILTALLAVSTHLCFRPVMPSGPQLKLLLSQPCPCELTGNKAVTENPFCCRSDYTRTTFMPTVSKDTSAYIHAPFHSPLLQSRIENVFL